MELEKELIELHKIKQHWNNQIPKAVEHFFSKLPKQQEEFRKVYCKKDDDFFKNILHTCETQIDMQVEKIKNDLITRLNNSRQSNFTKHVQSEEYKDS